MILSVLMILIGLSGGIVVGSGIVAFLTVLDVVPRLAQLTNTFKQIRTYQWAIILGSLTYTVIDLFNLPLPLIGDKYFVSIVGAFSGIFVGLLAAALTEVLNVIPILAKRIGMKEKILTLLMAMILGKVLGSLFHWFIFLTP